MNTSILSFVDNDLLISQEKTYNIILPELYSSYRVVIDLMVIFGLVIEHDKSEIFHFSRTHNDSNPELDFLAIGALTLKPKTYWRYLGFYFDQHLSFKKYIHYYSTKTLSMVKAIGILGNSTRSLFSLFSTLIFVTDISVILSRYMQAVFAVYIWNLGQQVLFFKALASKITASDAELFAIRLGIAKAISMVIKCIIFINNLLKSAR